MNKINPYESSANRALATVRMLREIKKGAKMHKDNNNQDDRDQDDAMDKLIDDMNKQDGEAERKLMLQQAYREKRN